MSRLIENTFLDYLDAAFQISSNPASDPLVDSLVLYTANRVLSDVSYRDEPNSEHQIEKIFEFISDYSEKISNGQSSNLASKDKLQRNLEIMKLQVRLLDALSFCVDEKDKDMFQSNLSEYINSYSESILKAFGSQKGFQEIHENTQNHIFHSFSGRVLANQIYNEYLNHVRTISEAPNMASRNGVDIKPSEFKLACPFVIDRPENISKNFWEQFLGQCTRFQSSNGQDNFFSPEWIVAQNLTRQIRNLIQEDVAFRDAYVNRFGLEADVARFLSFPDYAELKSSELLDVSCRQKDPDKFNDQLIELLDFETNYGENLDKYVQTVAVDKEVRKSVESVLNVRNLFSKSDFSAILHRIVDNVSQGVDRRM